jgi:hypothetical protein
VWLCGAGIQTLAWKKGGTLPAAIYSKHTYLIIIHKNTPEQPKQSNLNSINAKMKLCSMVSCCQFVGGWGGVGAMKLVLVSSNERPTLLGGCRRKCFIRMRNRFFSRFSRFFFVPPKYSFVKLLFRAFPLLSTLNRTRSETTPKNKIIWVLRIILIVLQPKKKLFSHPIFFFVSNNPEYWRQTRKY